MTPPLRILQVSEAFTGGVFASVTGLSNGLAERGHDVHVAFARRAETPADVAAHVHASVKLHELSLVRAIDPVADWKGLLVLRRLIRDLAPDIVHLHSSKAGVLGRIATRLSGRRPRLFYSPRGLSFLQEDHSPRARRLYTRIEWAMARLPGTIVACSESEMQLARLHIRPRRLALVENAVDVDAVPLRRDRGDGRLRVGGVGRITAARNPRLFVLLADDAATANVDFIWIGDGDPDDRALLEQHGVRVTGWLSRTAALAEMSRLDLYLHPSLWEGMPIALIEAQVCGLPAIVTDVVGNRDVIRHGETGFIGRDRAELAAHLSRLLGDAELRRSLGARARTLALARFNVRRMVLEYEQLYVRDLRFRPGARLR